MTEQLDPVFGRLLTAMVTPFNDEGELDLAKASELAKYLVDEQLNDSLVINGTTGESPTTTDEEKQQLLKVVCETVGDRAQVLAGVGTFSTAHTIKLAQQANEVGADGLLVVTPYYSRPPQDAVADHILSVADATDLPIMLYDIPHRSGIPIETDTFIEVAKHPNVVAVKDAKGSPVESSKVISATNLTYYAGDDAMTLPLMAVGGVGVVGTSTHFTGVLTKQMIETFRAGDLEKALDLYQKLLPVFTGVFATQGVMMVKAALNARGINVGSVRKPLLDASTTQTEVFLKLLDQLLDN
ncbi:MAG: 4-hydroxy-tetrahydrodipicolinate synthase [Propionibacterium sp.]|nr:MAG: 4-hydroxy-tetrahydrodipicolinate synthase [Propionibacterium sp.]